jgi:hypothetical protein
MTNYDDTGIQILCIHVEKFEAKGVSKFVVYNITSRKSEDKL